MPPRLRFGDVELDQAAFELRRGGAQCPVEPQVFELISYLARNAGRLVTKDELIEKVWNGRIVSDATLASRIKSARRAIGDDGGRQRWIKTVHGRGVRFVGEVETGKADAAAPLPPEQPGRPAIAVLPFHNPSGDPDDAFFADGVAEEITAALSRMRSLIVIARSSTVRYRDQAADSARVGRELGVRYLVQGSVRRSAGAVRINAQLIGAESGAQIWASHYDGKLSDVFELEDRITAQVVAAIAPTIRSVEIERARRKRPDSMEAYDYVMRALPQVWALTREAGLEALRLTQRAIELDPGYALAYALASWCHFWQFVNGWSADPETTRAEGVRMARAALRIDSDDPDVLGMVGAAEATLARNLDSAAALIDRALTLDPNSAWAWIRGGYCHVYRGNVELALQHFERAERLSPFDPLNFNRHAGVALAHFIAGRYDRTIEAAGKALAERPHLTLGHRVMAAAYGQLGEQALAAAAAEQVLRHSPGITIERILHVLPFAAREIGERFAEGLRRAGLPEAAAAEPVARPSIAVLPFLAIGDEAGEGNLADGLTEDIIGGLSRASGLFVVARNSVFAYRGKAVRLERVATELGVRHVLEGSVRVADGRVRISAQLVDGRTGGHLWSERYDRDLSDILALQDEIARSVVAALQVRLLPEEEAAIARRPTGNPKAYQYYLLGRSFFLRTGWGQRAMHVARQMFMKAAEVDPLYARAYAAIANCDCYLLCMGDPAVSFQSVLEHCARALRLDPELADAHAAKGLALYTAGRSNEAAVALERAMQLAPDSFEAHFFAARCHRAQGRHERAAALFERAGDLQPDDFRALGLAAFAYRAVGRHDEARAAALRCLERIEGELAVHADDAKALAFGASILADIGHTARARAWAERADALDPADMLTNYNLACAWVALGCHDAALDRLDRLLAIPAGTGQLHRDWMKHDAALVPLRDHPRYLALVRHLEADQPPVSPPHAGSRKPEDGSRRTG